MRADASHPDQVRDLLAEAAAVVTIQWERERVETLHESAMGLVEGEWEASERAWDQWLGEQQVNCRDPEPSDHQQTFSWIGSNLW